MNDVSPVPDAPESRPLTRWFSERTPLERSAYADRFVRLEASGTDVHGEARFVDALASRGAAILDAGCGVGRVAAELARAGHRAAGIDADPVLIARGRELYPGLALAALDLLDTTPAALAETGLPSSYDVVVAAGNVMLFLAPGSEAAVAVRLAGLLTAGGRAIFGFATGRHYTHDDLDRDVAAAGLTPEHRFGTWQADPFTPTGDWAVSVYRAGDSPSL